MVDHPLAGLKVLDLSRVVAGPLATQTLSDLGADVIKIESPLGDETRRFGPPFKGEWSTYFLSINRGKRSLMLDFREPQDLALLHKLLAVADVCVQNFRPGVAEKFQIEPERLRGLYPSLIIASISGFGLKGEASFSSRPGYDLILQGMGGLASLCGPPDGEPFKSPASIVDILTAQNAATGILAAVLQQRTTGEGVLLDLSMLESRIWSQMYHASGFLNAGKEPLRAGNQHASIVPYQTFKCDGGYLNIACGNDEQFKRLCTALELPDLPSDPRYVTNAERVRNRDTLLEVLSERIATFPAELLEEVLLAAKVPAGRVLSIGESLSITQHDARNFILGISTDSDVEYRFVRTPHGFPCPPSKRMPPRLDENRDGILNDWLGSL